MLVLSDNASANGLETLFGGSTSGGSALVNATMRSIGLERTEMYGGYVVGTSLEAPRGLAARRGIPLTVVDQPSWGIGKPTTALRPRPTRAGGVARERRSRPASRRPAST